MLTDCRLVKGQLSKARLEKVCNLVSSLNSNTRSLEKAVDKAGNMGDTIKQAQFFSDHVVEAMKLLRKVADKLEMNIDANLWQLPTYVEMLFLK